MATRMASVPVPCAGAGTTASNTYAVDTTVPPVVTPVPPVVTTVPPVVPTLPPVVTDTTALDTTRPRVRWVGGDLATLDLSDARPLALRFRVSESVRSTMSISRAGRVVRTYRTRVSSAGVVERLWFGRTQGGSRVRPGRYRVVVRAWDAAGNRTSATTHVRVTR